MSLWVKVCGLRTAQDVSAAVAAGADAIGFVFAPSVRRVEPAEALLAADAAPRSVARVAVFLHPTQAEVDAVIAGFAPDLVQTDLEDFAALRLPPGVGRLPVLRAGQATAGAALPPRCLVEGPKSGTGQVADWAAAAQLARVTQAVLAGGLHAGNVAAAIAAVQPWGVDVSSGVESAPGIKDAARIREFVAAARRAMPAAVAAG